MFKCFIMEVSFSRKLQKIFMKPDGLKKAYGARNERVIKVRIAVLRGLHNLSLVPTDPPERRHQLKGNRKEKFAVNLVHTDRLIFEVNHNPVPRKDDGGIDIEKVTAITIL